MWHHHSGTWIFFFTTHQDSSNVRYTQCGPENTICVRYLFTLYPFGFGPFDHNTSTKKVTQLINWSLSFYIKGISLYFLMGTHWSSPYIYLFHCPCLTYICIMYVVVTSVNQRAHTGLEISLWTKARRYQLGLPSLKPGLVFARKQRLGRFNGAKKYGPL